MATPNEIDSVWMMLLATYPYFAREQGQRLAQTLSVYQQLLVDVDGELLRTATLQHVASSKFFPTIAELRAQAIALVTPEAGKRTALEAWGEVMAAMADPQQYYVYADHVQSPDFSHDPILAAVVRDLGGMTAIGESTNSVADRARFIEAYEQRQRRQREDRLMLPQVRQLQERIEAGRNGSPQLPSDSECTAESRRGRVQSLTAGISGRMRP